MVRARSNPINPVPAAYPAPLPYPVPLPYPLPAADPIPPSFLAQPWWLVAVASIVAIAMIFSGKEKIEVVTKLIVELAKIIMEFFSEVIHGIFSAGVIVKDSGFIAASTIYNDFSVNKLVILCAVAVFFPMMGEMVQKLLAKPPK